MIEIILSNPLVLLLAASIIMMSLMFLFVGRKKKPKKKIEKVVESKKEKEDKTSTEKTQKDDEYNEKLKQISENFEKIEENDANNNAKSEKKVSKVYVRKQQNASNIETVSQEENRYGGLSERAEFVKTSKTVSKFGGFKTEEQIKQELQQEVKEEIENCDVCKNVSSYFDHSRRISKSVKEEDFDNLFASHITEHYLNIDAERHLSKKDESIFDRAEELIYNGESRALDADLQEVYNNLKSDKDKLQFWAEQNRKKMFQNEQDNKLEEQVLNDTSLSLRTMVFSDALLKRKKKK